MCILYCVYDFVSKGGEGAMTLISPTHRYATGIKVCSA